MSTPFHSSSNTTPDAPTGTFNVPIVTGASSGIGLEVTKTPAQRPIAWLRIPENIKSAMTLQAARDLKLVDGDIGLPFKKVVEVDSTEAIESAVEVGLGVGFVSRWELAKELELGVLKIAQLDTIRATRHFTLISKTGPEPQGLVDAFRAYTLKRAAHISKIRKTIKPNTYPAITQCYHRRKLRLPRTRPASHLFTCVKNPGLKESKYSKPTATESIHMPLINETAPDFTAETTQGTIRFHEWIGDGWAILFSHPRDFTPVCTTELGTMARLEPEFSKRNTKIIGLSVDPVGDHEKWVSDIEETQGCRVSYPMIGDPHFEVAKLYGMLPVYSGNSSKGAHRRGQRHSADRIRGWTKKIKLQLSYPMSTGRNFDEILRVLDSLQLAAKHRVSTRQTGNREMT